MSAPSAYAEVWQRSKKTWFYQVVETGSALPDGPPVTRSPYGPYWCRGHDKAVRKARALLQDRMPKQAPEKEIVRLAANQQETP